MTTAALIMLIICGLTVLTHIALMFVRGWLISETRREQNKMKAEWERFQWEQKEWQKKFEEEHEWPRKLTSRKIA